MTWTGSVRQWRWQWWLGSLACVLWGPLLLAQPERQAQTLQSLLQQGLTAFEAQDFPTAADRFDELHRVFEREPEYRDPGLQGVILPLRGYAALVTGTPADAVDHFEAYLAAFPQNDRRGPFVRFALAQSHLANGAPTEARAVFQDFVARYPTRPEAAMAQIRAAEIAVELGEIDDALAALNALYASRAAFSVRQEARLRALQLALAHDRTARAADILAETDWSVDTMPELAVLTFAALELADWHAGRAAWDHAIAAYRLVLPRDRLIALQTERQAELRTRIARQSRFRDVDATGIWGEYYRGVLRRVDAFLTELEAMDDYTGPTLLRYGMAYLQADRLWEAETVLASVAEDATFNPALREEAHYRWIVTAQERADWSDALAIAQTFVARYPHARQAPLALYLIGHALQNLDRLPEAITVFTDLMARYPDHPFFPRFVFSRGFAHLLHEDHPAAREDFSTYTTRFPHQALAVNARFWHAQAWFLEKQYSAARTEFDALLAATPPDHFLVPEIRYRRGAVLYAQRDYAGARAQLEEYLERHPEHASRAEAQVLLGDTDMGLGELVRAAIIFRQVDPAAGGLFPYAVFQSGKIFRAMEDYERMARHFIAYAQREDLTPHPRVSEALYWVGWAREQQGRAAEAFPLYRDALDRFGNDRAATEIQALLQSLHNLHDRYVRDPAGFGAWPERDQADATSLLSVDDFADWLTLEMERAWEAEALTWYGRLVTYLDGRQREAIARQYAGDEARLTNEIRRWRTELRGYGERIPQAAMDADTLATFGRLWTELAGDAFAAAIQSGEASGAPRLTAMRQENLARAQGLFADLLDRFPQSPARAQAYQDLIQIAMLERDRTAGITWAEAFIAAFPAHPDYPMVVLAWAYQLLALERADEAVPAVEELLRLRSARGKRQADAVMFLALAADRAGQTARAIAYYQNIYNLYRAYPGLVTYAYQRSAQLFEARGDLGAAYRTYREMTFRDDLLDAFIRDQAAQEMARLEPLVPVAQRTNADALAAEIEPAAAPDP